MKQILAEIRHRVDFGLDRQKLWLFASVAKMLDLGKINEAYNESQNESQLGTVRR
jgi:hypothetical protein